MTRWSYVKKYEHPRTWLWTKRSCVFSAPKSSIGSDHRISHMRPWVGGSRNLSIFKVLSDPRAADRRMMSAYRS